MGSASPDEIAVIGLSCRLPRAASPQAFWELLSHAGSAITETPSDRRPEADGGAGSRWGGYVENTGHFDADFFGISPREATAMDPQQRLMLELGWEALENAGIVPGTLSGADVGVFFGTIQSDYLTLTGRQGPAAVDHHTMTGLSRGLIANRVSHVLGLRGPSLTVDSAQSSSLVAVHLACESLRSGECGTALAGGVHLNLAPDSTAVAAAFGGLSPDGRCYTFDDRANGYVRGEGGGLVVLKPLSRALADGDHVYCVIRGSAVNNDGMSDGLTRPDAAAQEAVLRSAYQRAKVAPSEVQYVELHGTGTKVGDPIEASALGAVTGAGRPVDAPLAVGSVKTNIGHLEGAAGIAGLLKAVLAIQHGQLPPSLNHRSPNPRIPLAELGLRVQTELGDWGKPPHERLAGVSSFGIGGTNCHVVLAGPPPTEPTAPAEAAEPADEADAPARVLTPAGAPTPVVLSAKSAAALRGQAAGLAAFVKQRPDLDLPGMSGSLLRSRTVFPHRAVVLASDRAGLRSGLAGLESALPEPHVVLGHADPARDTRQVFVFPGQGAQWAGMGAELLEHSPVFASWVERCGQALAPHVDWSLPEVLRTGQGLEKVDVVQPASWAVMVSLAAMWEAAGVAPSAVVGHSQGEIAAATVAGALTPEDAARTVALRSRLIGERLAGHGAMLSVGLPEEAVRARLKAYSGVSVAVVNGPNATVVAGDPRAVEALEAEWRRSDTKVRRLAVDYASHSAQVDAVRAELVDLLSDIAPTRARVPFYSTVDCDWLDGSGLDAEYWARNLRQPVRFAEAVRNLLRQGLTSYVECSSHPVLAAAIADTADEAAVDGVTVTGSLRRDDGGAERFCTSLAEAYVAGAPVRWPALLADGGVPVPAGDLPTYAFQRRRLWLAAPPATGGDTPARPALPAEHLPAPPEASRTDADVSSLDLVRGQTATVLRTDAADVRVDRSFKEHGFDSIMAVELRNRLNAVTGLKLPSSAVFDHPTPARLARRVDALRSGTATAVTGATGGAEGSASDDPVVVVGMSCRFPGGVRSPEELWRLVLDGTDAIGEYPTDRHWDMPEPAGDGPLRRGGFLPDAADFDAEFFGISPREALAMDPQQRLLLEASWEALEAAGIRPETLVGSRTGVFAGAMAGDYGPRLHEGPDQVAGHLLTGLAGSVVSGRVAYTLGLEGPALTVDTACSSSLVALHLAAQALHRGECSLALASGVTVMSTPGMFTAFGRQRALAADGRCKAFSDAADGTGWSEGVAVLAVEKLSRARREGHRVLAVLRGSAVNQDGASNGLTAPNGPAQQSVIRQALAAAGLGGGDVDAVEAHGTGTTLGDPIEAQALLATYGQEHDADRPLWLGSLKSNIGHTQAAAGIAGVIKMVMAMRHGVLPRTLHVGQPSTHVDWSAGAVRLLTEEQPWPRVDRVRRAAVSSFGISGTNAHVILEQPLAESLERPAGDEPVAGESADRHPVAVPWVISGKSPAALTAQARSLLSYVEERPELRPADIAHALATRRTAFPYRAVAVGADTEALLGAVRAVADGRATAAAERDHATPDGKLAFMFTGQGAQFLGMGRELHAANPVFAAAFDAVTEELDRHLDQPVRDIVWGEEKETLDRTVYTQAALFALEVALYRTFESWGVRPDYLIGHSVGELTAAHVSGALSLPQAALLVSARGRLMQRLPSDGAMVAVQAREDEVLPLLDGRTDVVSVAAVNGPESVVLSGREAEVLALASDWQARGRKVTRLAVSHAFHSPLMTPMLDDFRTVAETLTFDEPSLPVVSNLTGRIATAEQLGSPDHWADHVRGTVRFADGIRQLREQGVTRFVELGPGGVLTAMARETLDDAERLILPALHRNRSETASLAFTAGRLHAAGVEVDWTAYFAGAATDDVDLPTYAFQRERFWLEPPAGEPDLGSAGLTALRHPLLAAAVPGVDGTVLTGRLSPRHLPWLPDHRVEGTVVVPGTALLEAVARAAEETGHAEVTELLLLAPLVVPADQPVDLQVRVSSTDASGIAQVEVFASASGTEGWTRHATGTLAVTPTGVTRDEPPAQWPPTGAERLNVDGYYAELDRRGLTYGPAFRGVRDVWRSGDDLFVEVRLPDPAAARSDAYLLHPALLDAVLHPPAVGELLPDARCPRLPFSWSTVRRHTSGASALRVRLRQEGPDTVRLVARDVRNRLVAEAGVVLRPTPRDQLRRILAMDRVPLYRMVWEPSAPAPAAVASGQVPATHRYLVVGDGPVAASAADRLTAGGASGTVRLEGLDAGTAPERVRAGLRAALAEIQSWLAGTRAPDDRLVVITRRACAAGSDPTHVDPVHAAIWGLVRTVQTEHPGLVGLVDLDEETDGAEALPAAVESFGAGTVQIAVRAGQLLVPVLRPATDPGASAAGDGGNTSAGPDAGPDTRWATSSVLVTGAGGIVGSALTRHAVATRGIGHVVLASRRGEAGPGVAELAAELRGLGATVTVAACDVSDRAQVEAVLAAVPATRPLAGVIHAAGSVADRVVETLTPEGLDAVLTAKADAVSILDDCTRGLNLDWFVVCSSVAGWWGTAGQANYAAANACLDALMLGRHRAGHRALSLVWGLWEERSELSGHLQDADIRRMSRVGIEPLSTADALRAFDAALGLGEPVLAPVRLGTQDLPGSDARTLPPFLAPRTPLPGRPVRTRADNTVTTADRAGTADRAAQGAAAAIPPVRTAEQRHEDLMDLVRSRTATVLGRDGLREDQLPESFSALGFDSLMMLELRNHLSAATGLQLSPTLLFDHPTPPAVVDHLAEALAEADAVPDTTDANAEPAPESVPVAIPEETDDPIVVVGMACRYPGGVTDPDGLWNLVAGGVDGVSDFPTDRGWNLETLFSDDPDQPGTSYARAGGFLHDAAWFDADFFGISPREARATDPQQRLMLETSWEALEHAGIDPRALKGSPTGVFAGVMYHDYGSRLQEIPDGMEGYLQNGSLGSVLSGRVSYVLGLEGPAVSVDTACSSSLVALHLASQALRQGECSLALVGGVTVMSTPRTFIDFSRQRALAADGRCKAFSADADGTGWAEGAGVLVVERLSRARRNGHQVLAVVRGSAVNQDGASNGLTAPSGPSQQRVIRQALDNAGLSPDDIDVIEAHGTGTALGDPIEAQALLATYGRERPRPLWLGSLKSNIGHTQAAAGVGGIIKMVMAMRHGVMPRTLHAENPSPHVDWSGGAVRLLTEQRAWAAEDRPRRAAVSSFGISGTNAHIILEQPAAAEAERFVPAAPAAGVTPWVLSGKTPAALTAQAARLLRFAGDRPEVSAADIGVALAANRSVFRRRAVVLGTDRTALLAGLAAAAQGAEHPGVVTADATRRARKTAFLFAGQGSQRVGMGRELYRAFPAYAEAFDTVSAALEPHLGRSPADVLFADADDPDAAALLDRTDYAQPCLFAFQVALHHLLTSWGVRPACLAGHSVGEIAAAHVSGVLSLPDAAALVAARGRLMAELPEGGAMVAVQASEDEVGPLLAGSAAVGVAAVNGPMATVLSGEGAQVAEAVRELERRGRRTRALRVSHAFHSPLMEPMLDRFREVVSGISFGAPRIPLVSTLTGAPAGPGDFTSAEYWVRHVREAVRFHDGVRALETEGVRTFVELGSGTTLSALVPECLSRSAEATLVPLLRKGRPEGRSVLEAAARLFVQGAAVRWDTVLEVPADARPPVDLPTYAFQRERFWLDPAPAAPAHGVPGGAPTGYPLLDTVVRLAHGGVVLRGELSAANLAWLPEHQVGDTVVVPSTAILEMLGRAGRQTGSERVAELVLRAPMVVPAGAGIDVQVYVSPADRQGVREVQVHSRPTGSGDDVPWTDNAVGRLAARSADAVRTAGAMPVWPPAATMAADLTDVYPGLARQGLTYGTAFRGLRSVRRGEREIYAEVVLPEPTAQDAATHLLHPALLDAALHALVLPGVLPGDGLRLPFSWSGLEIHRPGAAQLRVRLTPTGENAVAFTAWDPDGTVVATADNLTLRPFELETLGTSAATSPDCLFEVEWVPVPPAPTAGTAPTRSHLVLTGDPRAAETVARMRARGLHVRALECLGEDTTDPVRVRAALGAVMAEAQAWVAAERNTHDRLVVITHGAVVTGEPAEPVDPAQAAVWGMLRTAQTEHPGQFALVDLDAPRAADHLTALPLGEEPQLAVRYGQAYAPRLITAAPVSDARQAAGAALPQADGTRWGSGSLLVTGAGGVVGSALSRHAVTAYGVGHVILLSRSGERSPAVVGLAEELRGLGASVTVEACDVTDREQVAGVLSRIPADLPLRGVIHAAGATRDGMFRGLTPEALEAVLPAKLDAVSHLDGLTRDLGLDWFVVCSSAAGWWGNAGQANYAASNACVDAMVQRRRAAGHAALSLGWGLWAERSELSGHLDEGDLRRLARLGILPLATEDALKAFDAALTAQNPVLFPVRLDTSRLSCGDPTALTPLLREHQRRAADTVPADADPHNVFTSDAIVPVAGAGGAKSLPERLAGLDADARVQLLQQVIAEEVAAVLGHADPSEVEPDRAFSEIGFDSLTALELRNRIEKLAGRTLTATLVFDHPSPEALARYLHTELGEPEQPAPRPAVAEPVRPRPAEVLPRATFVAEAGAPEAPAASRPLEGRTVVLTGATGALGRLYAKAIGAAGANVVLTGRDAGRLGELTAALEERGTDALSLPLDLSDRTALPRLVAQATERFGAIDALVNNAGVTGPAGPLWETDDDEWWHAMEVNLRGTAAACRAVLPTMIQGGGGRIVNIVSAAGKHRWPNVSGYSVSKAAVIKLGENLAIELADTGTSVFSYHPGLVNLGITQKQLDLGFTGERWSDEVTSWMMSERDAGRFADPERSAATLIRLLAGEADSLSGRYLTVDDDLSRLLGNPAGR
ncbi:type I polyketide synthase [Streptomyces sp. S465]|uniref:type I polyketide synthase n=1 Tax=Streptomyces sp. S465 TaxID=2979468 RepID=UPI0022A88CF5|nr:type I polyketide synthase [Streptomyces sp. S465]WAP54160.1 SDR family NAD(P)-dependent oxidoreductase [Streptomyces sp. S465]